MLKKLLLFSAIVFALFTSNRSLAQSITPQNLEKLQIMEDSMMTTADSMYQAFLPDTHVGYSERFARQLVKTLKIPNSFMFPFDRLKEKITIIYPDDNSFRIFNWGINTSPIFKRYYGAVQIAQENLKLYGLSDYSEQLGRAAEDSVLTNGKWYGAEYYRIMTQELEGQRVYTLFGFNGAGGVSNKKLLDPMTITENGVVFGAPIFAIGSKNIPKQPIKRFILEYKKGVQVGLNWDNEKQAIIFDDLVSQVNDPNRKYTYVPSGEYNAMIWGNGMWNVRQNIMPIQILTDGQAPQDDDQPGKK